MHESFLGHTQMLEPFLGSLHVLGTVRAYTYARPYLDVFGLYTVCGASFGPLYKVHKASLRYAFAKDKTFQGAHKACHRHIHMRVGSSPMYTCECVCAILSGLVHVGPC